MHPTDETEEKLLDDNPLEILHEDNRLNHINLEEEQAGIYTLRLPLQTN